MRNRARIEQSSIYNSLHHLARGGFVKSEKKADGRLRRIYELTDRGLQTLQREVNRSAS
jgi:DNA-binding PadR family transcriptional regulator